MIIRIDINGIRIDLRVHYRIIFKHAAKIFEPADDPGNMPSSELAEKPQRILFLTLVDNDKRRIIVEHERTRYARKKVCQGPRVSGRIIQCRYHLSEVLSLVIHALSEMERNVPSRDINIRALVGIRMQILELDHLSVVRGEADDIRILPQRIVADLTVLVLRRLDHLLVERLEVIRVFVIQHIRSAAESAVGGHGRDVVDHDPAAVLTIKVAHISIPCLKYF